MLRQLLLIIITISGVLAVPLFIVQDADECQFKMQESSVLSTGTYIFQQIQSLQFDFIITANGNCPDLPLVYLRNETSISMAGSMERYGDMIRLLGEIQAPGKHLILVVPSTEGCDFEMQQQSSLGLQLPNCRVGDQFPIDFQPATQNEADWMNDFVDLMDDQEIPESVSDLLLIDGIRNYVAYDYKTKWENLSKDAKNGRQHSSYREIREVYLKIERFITGDLSQQNEAEATAKTACAYLNYFIDNPKQRVEFTTITISGFHYKWKTFALDRHTKIPEMVIQSKESRLGKCLVSSTTPAVLSAGTYVFRHLLQVRQLQSLQFDFQLKTSHASCLYHLPSVLLRDSSPDESVGTTLTEDGMIRISGQIQSSAKECILRIPFSTTCVYELVQASLTLQLPTEILDGLCRIGEQPTVIEWEKLETDPARLELMCPDLLLTREFHKLPKSLAHISLIDGVWNYIRFNYEARWKRLSKDERMAFNYPFRQLRYVYKRLEGFIKGEISQRSDVVAAARAACGYLNSGMRNPVDFQLVSLTKFQNRWTAFAQKPKHIGAPVDPRQLPTRLAGITVIDAIHNYVVYNYTRQWKALSVEDRKPFKNM